MDEGDVVLYYRKSEIVGIGVVADNEYYFDPKQAHGHQRKVTFVEPFEPVDVTLDDSLRRFFANRNTLKKITGKKLSKAIELIMQANEKLDIRELTGIEVISQTQKSTNGTTFPGFDMRAFDLLEIFQSNPTKDAYKEHKSDFERYLRDPLRALFREVAPPVQDIVGNAIQTKTNILSRITKNDFGRGGIHHHYWGAFYEPEAGRQDSSQLYIILSDGHLRIGFGLGVKASTFKERLIRGLGASDIVNDDYFNALVARGIETKIPHDDNIASVAKTTSANSFLQILKEHDRPSLEISIPAEDVISAGATLVKIVTEVFDLLMPVMLIATFDQPDVFLNKWQGAHAEDDDSFEEDEAISWEDFTTEMNWDDNTPEAQQISRLLDIYRNFERATKQLILFGAPGSGKTMAALELSKLIASNEDCVERVQFHQSYSYENFIEGIRPVTRDGSLTYEIEPGPFVKFCRRASKSPKQRFIFIIDEVNRGNLSRIFGELLFLLEYRDETMPLMYSKTPFGIPENVFIIGTMNSADRSIALVDYALRRRFSFVEFTPSADVLRQWFNCEVVEHQTCLTFFEILNERISQIDRKLAIGHSYLIQPRLKHTGLTKIDLRNIWISNIYPLLEEYFCNLPNKLSDFDFDELWKLAQGNEHTKEAV